MKYRPLDFKCVECDDGVVIAGFWVSGNYKVIKGRKKLVSNGYWSCKCNKCNVRVFIEG